MLPPLAWLRDPDRPILFSVVFWVVLSATGGAYAFRDGAPSWSPAFVLNLALVAALWPLLPWRRGNDRRRRGNDWRRLDRWRRTSDWRPLDRWRRSNERRPLNRWRRSNERRPHGESSSGTASRRDGRRRFGGKPGHDSRWRRVAAVAFLPATFTLGPAGSAEVHQLLTLIALANVAFVFGMRAAYVIVGCICLVGFASIVVVFERGVLDAAVQTVTIVVFACFVLGMASAVLEARRRRAETQRLAARVRELTVAQERARMGAEMHDSIGHHLTVIKMGLENAERFRSRRPDDAWHEVRQAKELTVTALTDARRWVRALRPLSLDGPVSGAALGRLAASFDGTGLAVSFEVVGAEPALEPDVELVLYRVLQEGLTNAVRHAGAHHVRGTLACDGDRVVLVVADDGVGRGPYARDGFGLRSLAERARALGGALTAGDRPGGGFEVRADLPVRVAAAMS
ncbi:sensor histidine kinase [Nonomuraea deserti]|uniref:histidine kinase n=1 Tax=Nonomuraea deserti TaxID=1848322 RepID=A0A4R4UES3_9ACTN|nr:sensor histidine kinase [Nonomuraea deserti]TDC87354.1 sensor histidine kinase [Nonomuraea deserti]